MPNLTWNMDLNSNARLYNLCTCKILEMLTTIRILIFRNLLYIVPVFKKCNFFTSEVQPKV